MTGLSFTTHQTREARKVFIARGPRVHDAAFEDHSANDSISKYLATPAEIEVAVASCAVSGVERDAAKRLATLRSAQKTSDVLYYRHEYEPFQESRVVTFSTTYLRTRTFLEGWRNAP